MKSFKMNHLTNLHLAALIFFLLSDSAAAQEWRWQYPSESPNPFNCVKIISPGNVVLAGGGGVVFKSSDGGVTFSQQFTGIASDILSMDFANSDTGFCGTADGFILFTENEGYNWAVTDSFGYPLRNLVYAGSGICYGTMSYDSIIRSTNYGKDWVVIGNIPGIAIYDLFFVNTGTGYAAGDFGQIYKTTNGGVSWVLLQTNYEAGFKAVYFTSPNTGFAVGDASSILRTTNGGQTWVSTPVNAPLGLSVINFSSPLTGYISGQFGTFLRTTNGGASWIQSDSIASSYTVHDMDFHSGIGVAAGSYGLILRMTDGSNWQIRSIHSLNAVLSLSFPSHLTGYGSDLFGGVMKTNNGGAVWERVQINKAINLNSIYFINDSVGFTSGFHNSIYKTTDYGETWSEVTVPHGQIYSIYFPDSLTGYAGTLYGNMMKTTNAGAAWFSVTDPGFWVFDMHFFSAARGFIVSEYGGLLYTSNGGQSWVRHPVITDNVIRIDFPTPLVGYAYKGGLWRYKTTDGGLTWFSQQEEYLNNSTYGLHFLNADTGYISGQFGKVYITVNGGVTWQEEITGVYAEHTLYDIVAASAQQVYTAGSFNSILKRTGRKTAPNTAPVLLTPANNSQNVPLAARFTWSPVEDSVYYSFQISQSADFSSLIISGRTDSLSFGPITADTLNFNTVYHWRVRAENSMGSGPWSVAWSFRTVPPNTVYGDVDLNTQVQAFDASQILKYLSGTITLNRQQKLNADVNVPFDGITAFDASLILRFRVGLVNSLPFSEAVADSAAVSFLVKKDKSKNILSIYIYRTLYKPLYSASISFTWKPEHFSPQHFNFSALEESGLTEIKNSGGRFNILYASIGEISPGQDSLIGVFSFNGDLRNTKPEDYPHCRVQLNLQSITEYSVNEQPHHSDGNREYNYELKDNYPNPWNPSTRIDFTSPLTDYAELTLYSAEGEKIRTLFKGMVSTGYNSVQLHSEGLASGVYFYRLQIGSYSNIKKMILLK